MFLPIVTRLRLFEFEIQSLTDLCISSIDLRNAPFSTFRVLQIYLNPSLFVYRRIREEERTAGLLFLSCFFFPFLFSHRRVQIKFLPRVEKYPISNLFRLMNFAALKRLLVYSFACSAFCRSWNEGGGERERGRKGKTDWIYQRNKQVSVNDRYVRTWEKSVGRSRTESRDFSLEYWFWRKRIEIFVRFLPFLLRSNS